MNEVRRVLLSRKTLIFFALALLLNCVFFAYECSGEKAITLQGEELKARAILPDSEQGDSCACCLYRSVIERQYGSAFADSKRYGIQQSKCTLSEC